MMSTELQVVRRDSLLFISHQIRFSSDRTGGWRRRPFWLSSCCIATVSDPSFAAILAAHSPATGCNSERSCRAPKFGYQVCSSGRGQRFLIIRRLPIIGHCSFDHRTVSSPSLGRERNAPLADAGEPRCRRCNHAQRKCLRYQNLANGFDPTIKLEARSLLH